MVLRCFFLNLLLMITFSSPAISNKLLPVDEAGQDSSFLIFRNQLQEAMEQNDIWHLDRSMHPDPLLGHKGEIDNDLFLETISLGGRFTHPDTFIAPYVTAAWPEKADQFSHFAAIEDSVPVFSQPENKGIPIAFLSYDIVGIAMPGRSYHYPHKMVRIQTKAGVTGWVSMDKIRSPLNHRIYFVRYKKDWKIKYVTKGCYPPAPAIKVLPVDEAAQDSSFLAFRTRLKRAVADKDTTYTFSILRPDIQSSFGGHVGIDMFKDFWGFTGEANNKKDFWEEMESVLSRGGAFRDSVSFTAPYFFASWPRFFVNNIELDAFFFVAATGKNIPVYSEPDSSSIEITRLNYDIVLKARDHYKYGKWLRIYTMAGLPGFVREDLIRSPIDYRAGFIKENNRWLMRFFLAGD